MPAAAEMRTGLAAHGAQSIAKGSKSFALASLLFGAEMRRDVHMLYAWCRHCDDVIDGQTSGADAPDGSMSRAEMRNRLAMLREKTRMALRGEPTGLPAFDGFAMVARRRAIPEAYAMDLLDGFAHDAQGRTYETIDELMAYCYGVAGVVGVMMAIVMGVDPYDDETLDRACDLGLAFQLTNICRDVVDDAKGGRIYLPLGLLKDAGVAPSAEAVCKPENRAGLALVAARLLTEADRYYASASAGARRLPLRAAAAVLAARNVYREIGRKVRARGAHAWDERTFVSGGKKRWLAASGIVEGAAQRVFARARALPAREKLWRRPVRI